jgi:hypothetical protein
MSSVSNHNSISFCLIDSRQTENDLLNSENVTDISLECYNNSCRGNLILAHTRNYFTELQFVFLLNGSSYKWNTDFNFIAFCNIHGLPPTSCFRTELFGFSPCAKGSRVHSWKMCYDNVNRISLLSEVSSQRQQLLPRMYCQEFVQEKFCSIFFLFLYLLYIYVIQKWSLNYAFLFRTYTKVC